MVESLSAKEIVEYPNGGRSHYYVTERTAIIVDEGICKCDAKDEVFPYTLIMDKRNYYMHRYEKVYRFLAEDKHTIESVVRGAKEHADMDFTIRVANREENADASPLELLFERNFSNVYGMNALKYLWKEYGVVDAQGHNYFLDYYVRTGDGGIAVEENGVSYHHPQIIGLERYRKQLQKQNTCTQWGIKLYRFSTEDCQFESRIEDDIRTFFGEDVSRFEENGLLIDRPVELYEHQGATLQDIEQKRKEGVKTFLIVFPTASGKSKIVEEDMRAFTTGKSDFKALVLAPNTNIVKDWHRRIEESLKEYQDKIEVNTLAYIVRNYTNISPKEYSYIVIDEVQLLPKARQAIKYLVADGRYKYIETGSLLSIKRNTKDILIPSEEHKISMYPMDFEEFLWAIGDEITADTIRLLIQSKKSAGNAMHRNMMRLFRLYMLVGGMPQAVETYLEQNNLQVVDEIKREIIDLYEEDFIKIDGTGLAGDIYDAIPASLSGNASRYVLSNAREGIRSQQVRELVPDILSSYTVNIAYHANNPGVGMALEKDAGRYKLFTSDVGLFVTLAFKDKNYTENVIYNKLLLDKLEANLGYVYECVVAQMLIAKGNNLFYYTMQSDTSNHLYEIDFLTLVGDKINPIEVKSGNYRGHKSLDIFCGKFSRRIKDKYVVHTKDYKWENGIHYVPVYMVPFWD